MSWLRALCSVPAILPIVCPQGLPKSIGQLDHLEVLNLNGNRPATSVQPEKCTFLSPATIFALLRRPCSTGEEGRRVGGSARTARPLISPSIVEMFE